MRFNHQGCLRKSVAAKAAPTYSIKNCGSDFSRDRMLAATELLDQVAKLEQHIGNPDHRQADKRRWVVCSD